jgi:hypothetical protein
VGDRGRPPEIRAVQPGAKDRFDVYETRAVAIYMFKLLVIAFVSFLVLSASAIAQPVIFDISPPHATTADEILFTLGGFPGCGQQVVATRVVGQSIEIDVEGFQADCPTTLPPEAAVRLALPGVYTVRVIYNGPQGIVIGPQTTFEVTLAPEHIPAVETRMLVALAFLLVIIGVRLLHEGSS